jgi:DNA-binding MarR family transcriptional regulator
LAPHGEMPPIQSGLPREALEAGADVMGLELLRHIKMVNQLYEALENEHLRALDISGPRFRILIHLLMEGDAERRVSPTDLSLSRNVSKNTTSWLLRGLAEQGLIERTQDPLDKRVSRIRITEAGRQLVVREMPAHLAGLSRLAAGLSGEEQQQLLELLVKLQHSIMLRGHEHMPGHGSGGE